MSFEDGFDVNKYAGGHSLGHPGRGVARSEQREVAEAVRDRVRRIKDWLEDTKDVASHVKGQLWYGTYVFGEDMKAINLSALKYAHPNTATAIIFGLGTGMRVGEYAEFGLRVIRDELNSPEGRYRRELARIDREYPGHTVEERRIRMVRLNEADDRLEEAQARALNPGDYLQDLEQTEPESQLGPLLDLADEVEDGE